MTCSQRSDTPHDTGSTAEDRQPETLSDYLPQAARALREYGVELVRSEYASNEMLIIVSGSREGRLSHDAAKMIALEIHQHLTLILRRRYPSYFEGDGSKGIFEWDLRTDTLKHEHTRIHRGL
ncbi:MAG TPA: hypothetical protein VG963_11055 [Polyangiaceae bacterium]|nr:hypothetical protein [Polyangiaceae bacterium]